MKVLLDTHFALWLAVDRQALTSTELAFIGDSQTQLAASAVSFWELRIKWNKRFRSGQRKGPSDPRHILGALDRMGVLILPLLATDAVVSLNDPVENRDPFDEQLLIQAQENGMRLLTRDALLLDHPLAISAL